VAQALNNKVKNKQMKKRDSMGPTYFGKNGIATSYPLVCILSNL